LSLKENVAMVREELNSEEKMLESAIKAEQFVKKYKNLLMIGAIVVALGIGANIAYEVKKEADTTSANAALSILQKNPSDADALQTLQTLNPDLYALWQLSQALENSDVAALKTLEDSKATAIADVAAYHAAVKERDIAALERYVLQPSAIYKEMATLELAFLLMKNDRVDEARSKLETFSSESPLYRQAQSLLHYGVK
jgi:hypothetical protein